MIKLPIPTPKPKEDQKTFIPRCISAVHDADPNRPQKQIIAICYSAWRKSKRKRTTQETKEIVDWYESKVNKPPKKNEDKNEPNWVKTARRLLASKRGSPKLREYWKKRLEKYEASKK